MSEQKTIEIKEEVKSFILENFIFDDEAVVIGDSDSFMDGGIIDSTGILELIDYLESNYSIELDDDEIIPDNLDSLNNISRFILMKQA